MLYIRKIFKQDLRDGKQIAFTKEPSLVFFNFNYIQNDPDRHIDFTFNDIFNQYPTLNGAVITTRLYAAKSESRIDSQLKNFLIDKLSAKVDDIIIFENVSSLNNKFNFIYIPVTSPNYSILTSLISNNNHTIFLITKNNLKLGPLQQIFYGAPGTGKSHEIQEKEDGFAKVFRTTFHPDSDYSTFVGCYKPVTEKAKLWAPDNVYHPQTAVLLANPNNIENISYRYEAQAFVKAYIEAWKLYAEQITNISAIASATSTGTAAPSEEHKHKEENVKPELPKNNEDGNLPNEKENGEAEQVNTWNHIPCVLLDIEEINRGNCAQIFGDLFQLLDRNDNGFSEYEIIPDSALTKHLANAFKDLDVHVPDIDCYFKKEYKSHIKDGNTRSEDIQSGDILILPPNLYIWATMNTSDQSLFPMDSAFKRRWDWVYVPIAQGMKKDMNGKETEEPLGWQIEIDDKHEPIDWWKFLQKVNAVIAKLTSSEDKQLGYFFCKPDEEDKKTISAKKFVGKVIFYLWNDILKDYAFDDPICKKGTDQKETLYFADFYIKQNELNIESLITFFKNLDKEQPEIDKKDVTLLSELKKNGQ